MARPAIGRRPLTTLASSPNPNYCSGMQITSPTKEASRQSEGIHTNRSVVHIAALGLLLTLAGCNSPGSSSGDFAAKVMLGKQLFSDPGLSADRQVSCATCHDPKRYFTQTAATSVGAHGKTGTRNAPSLLDTPHARAFFWDGREAMLQQAVLQPFTNPVEMGLPDTNALLQRVRMNPDYVSSFEQIFDRAPDKTGIADALSTYISSLPAAKSSYHRSLHGRERLSEDEEIGLALFQGKAGCGECHHLADAPPTPTDHTYHHTGIGFDKVAGHIAPMLVKLDALQQQGKPIGVAILSDSEVAELGRFAVTRKPSDLGAFRTPSLRNVAVTAPYMHDGSVPTLSAAVDQEIYYRSLARGRQINLTVEEKRQLLAFLSALTDD